MNQSYHLAVKNDCTTNQQQQQQAKQQQQTVNAEPAVAAAAKPIAPQATANETTTKTTTTTSSSSSRETIQQQLNPKKSAQSMDEAYTRPFRIRRTMLPASQNKTSDDRLRRASVRTGGTAAAVATDDNNNNEEFDSFVDAASSPSASMIRFADAARLSSGFSKSFNSPSSRRLTRYSSINRNIQRQPSNIFAMLSQSQIEELKEAFGIFDQDRDNVISREDLRKLLLSLGKAPDEEYLDSMLNDAAHNSSTMNFTMFLTLFGQKMQGTDTEETITMALQSLIATLEPNELPLTVTKLKELLMTCGPRELRMDETQVDELFQQAYRPVLMSAAHNNHHQAAEEQRSSSSFDYMIPSGGGAAAQPFSDQRKRLSEISSSAWADLVEIEPTNFAHFLKTGFVFPDEVADNSSNSDNIK